MQVCKSASVQVGKFAGWQIVSHGSALGSHQCQHVLEKHREVLGKTSRSFFEKILIFFGIQQAVCLSSCGVDCFSNVGAG
jgi:hypothetical protein